MTLNARETHWIEKDVSFLLGWALLDVG